MAATARADQQLSDDELQAELARNELMAAYVERNGLPDVADSRFLSDRPPWADHEVTLYYLDRRKEISFAKAYILQRPIIDTTRFERTLTDEEVAALSARARRPSSGGPSARRMGPAERAEEAARRAETAASRVETAAASAERAAERTEAILAKAESGFNRQVRK
jgi:hypothetical protein